MYNTTQVEIETGTWRQGNVKMLMVANNMHEHKTSWAIKIYAADENIN